VQKALTFCSVAVVVAFALGIMLLHGSKVSTASAATVAQTEAVVPRCQQSRYGANGNMSPLFCIVDNPEALRYFSPMAKLTFALGPDATSSEVINALAGDYQHGGTGPILCSIYRLAAWRNHWAFGISIIDTLGERLNLPANWCAEPSFKGAT